MKKILFVFVVALLFMAGCSGEKEESAAPKEEKPQEERINRELEKFIDEYNYQVEKLNNSESDLPELKQINRNDIGELKKEKHIYWQKLLKNEQEEVYEISARYNTDKELIGLHVFSLGNLSNGNSLGNFSFSDSGVTAGLVVARSIGLDVETYAEEFGTVVNGGTGTRSYYDSEYEINFIITPDTGSYVVNFDKTE